MIALEKPEPQKVLSSKLLDIQQTTEPAAKFGTLKNHNVLKVQSTTERTGALLHGATPPKSASQPRQPYSSLKPSTKIPSPSQSVPAPVVTKKELPFFTPLLLLLLPPFHTPFEQYEHINLIN